MKWVKGFLPSPSSTRRQQGYRKIPEVEAVSKYESFDTKLRAMQRDNEANDIVSESPKTTGQKILDLSANS